MNNTNQFSKYDEIIKENKNNMLDLIIYYNLKCNDLIVGLNDEQIRKIIGFINKCYLKDETHLDLSHICDIALKNQEKILNDNFFTPWELLNLC